MSNRVNQTKKQAKVVAVNAKIHSLYRDLKEANNSNNVELAQNISKEIKSQKIRLKALYDSQNIVVSEHALIRYMERILCIDTHKIEQQIIKFANKNNHHLYEVVVVDNVITTIIAKDD